MTKEEIARRILMIEGELNFALSIGNVRQSAVLRRQLHFWLEQQENEQHKETQP